MKSAIVLIALVVWFSPGSESSSMSMDAGGQDFSTFSDASTGAKVLSVSCSGDTCKVDAKPSSDAGKTVEVLSCDKDGNCKQVEPSSDVDLSPMASDATPGQCTPKVIPDQIQKINGVFKTFMKDGKKINTCQVEPSVRSQLKQYLPAGTSWGDGTGGETEKSGTGQPGTDQRSTGPSSTETPGSGSSQDKNSPPGKCTPKLEYPKVTKGEGIGPSFYYGKNKIRINPCQVGPRSRKAYANFVGPDYTWPDRYPKPPAGKCTLSSKSLSAEDKQGILAAHNQLRDEISQGKYGQPAAKNLKHLVWDEEAAAEAQKWANNCYYSHSSTSYGQNIAMRGSSSTTGAELVKMWKDEVKDMQPGIVASYRSLLPAIDIGHYTQMVWAGTKKVGCGLSKFTGQSCNIQGSQQSSCAYLVCNYAPGGNMPGKPVYQT